MWCVTELTNALRSEGKHPISELTRNEMQLCVIQSKLIRSEFDWDRDAGNECIEEIYNLIFKQLTLKEIFQIKIIVKYGYYKQFIHGTSFNS